MVNRPRTGQSKSLRLGSHKSWKRSS